MLTPRAFLYQDNLKVLQSFEKTCTAYKPNIDELEDINQVK